MGRDDRLPPSETTHQDRRLTIWPRAQNRQRVSPAAWQPPLWQQARDSQEYHDRPEQFMPARLR